LKIFIMSFSYIKVSSLTLGTLVAVFVAGCGAGDTAVGIDARSKLTFGTCAVKFEDSSAICGTLTVAQDRTNKSSKLIGLPFVILPAKAAQPAKDPIAIYTGGPGNSPLQTIAGIPAEGLENFPLRQKRDVIVLTHRGTELTEGGTIECPEVILDFAAGERYQDVGALISNSKKCRDRIVAEGIDPLQYNTKTIARDMEDFRLLLGKSRGFTEWNILGSSYGSLLAQQSVRDTPAGGIRSVVFDGPVPIQNPTFFASNILEGLEAIIVACQNNPACEQEYPNLRARFSSAILALEATPMFLEGSQVNGQAILSSLRRTLPVFQPQYELVPLFMGKVIEGDLAGANLIFNFLGNPEIASGSSGMFYTVSCTDAGNESFTDASIPSGALNWTSSIRRLAARAEYGVLPQLCPTWVTESARAIVDRSAVKSNVPALITVGQFDIATPAVDADVLLASLSRGQKVVFTGRGHGLAEGEPCMLLIASAFFDNPVASVNKDCVEPLSSLRFNARDR
jgi:pimeloyl-ACP methyl ester carboxylesterase